MIFIFLFSLWSFLNPSTFMLYDFLPLDLSLISYLVFGFKSLAFLAFLRKKS